MFFTLDHQCHILLFPDIKHIEHVYFQEAGYLKVAMISG